MASKALSGGLRAQCGKSRSKLDFNFLKRTVHYWREKFRPNLMWKRIDASSQSSHNQTVVRIQSANPIRISHSGVVGSVAYSPIVPTCHLIPPSRHLA